MTTDAAPDLLERLLAAFEDTPLDATQERVLRDVYAELTTSRATCARLQERCSTLEDAAHHFWGCVTCAQDGENCCIEGRKFAAFLRGEAVNED